MIKFNFTRKDDSIVYVTDNGCKTYDSSHPCWKEFNKKLDDFIWHLHFLASEPTYYVQPSLKPPLVPEPTPSSIPKVWVPIRSKTDDVKVLYPEVYAMTVSVISEQLGIATTKLTPETVVNYDSLGMDSLDGVELCMAFEEVFEIEIPDEEVEKYADATIAQIVTDIAKVYKPSPKSTGNTYYDKGLIAGKTDGVADVNMGVSSPKYHREDAQAADSKEHADFIRGYWDGYRYFISS